LDCPEFQLEGDPRAGKAVYNLDLYKRIIVVGAAKGVQRAVLALEEILGDRLTGGHVIGKHGDGYICKKVGVTLAGHPAPDKYCVEGCKKIFEWAEGICEKDLVITVIGSGVSSLMTWPIEGVSIEEMSAFTHIMQIEKGAQTDDLNVIRNHLDRFKGGKISRYFSKAALIHLVTTDIGMLSTPVTRATYQKKMATNRFLATLADGTTFADAMQVFEKYDAWNLVSKRIQDFFLKADPADEGVRLPEFEATNARIFGLTPKISFVYPAVYEKAREFGYTPYMLCERMNGEAKDAGIIISSIALNILRMGEPVKPPCVLITSGETVVTVGDRKNVVGGRNQEYCIAAAQMIAGCDKIVIGAVDTDGTDGPGGLSLEGAPECLAGAIVDGDTIAQAKAKGINLQQTLKTHNTSEAMWYLRCGVHATPGISVLDLGIVAIMK
jgi:glycerate-2-kinase